MENFSRLTQLFIELRNSGASLSSMDLEILYTWSELKIPAEYIESFMWDLANELDTKDKKFPQSLIEIDKRLQRQIRVRSTQA